MVYKFLSLKQGLKIYFGYLKDEVKNVSPSYTKHICYSQGNQSNESRVTTKNYLRSPLPDDLVNSEIHYRRLFESVPDS